MKRTFVFAAACAAFATAAGAQQLKPGLWEINQKMQGAGMDARAAQMQQQMANMPPDQRKMVEEMMAKQGVKMGAGGPGGMSMRVCMTKEMVERNEVAAQRGDCTTTMKPRMGATMRMAFSCRNPPSSGEGEVTFASPEAYSMKMMMTTSIDGKPEKMNMEGSGKWLGADCGNIRPIVPPKK